MSDQKLDEVDGEVPVSSSEVCKPKLTLKNSDLEKSLIDSGMDDGSNSGSVDTGDNSDDDDIVLRKPKKIMHRILDDDSDVSQDVPVQTKDETVQSQTDSGMQDGSQSSQSKQDESQASQSTQKEPQTGPGKPDESSVPDPRFDPAKEVIDMREKRKQEFTPEQALDVIMQDSSDDSDQEITPAKKKRIKAVTEDQSDDEKADMKEGYVSDSEDEETTKRKNTSSLFPAESDSDSSGCRSSGSEVEKSDNEQGDEGFDESTVDPKLLAKLKKGAAKKPKKPSKRDELKSIHSESQRLVRESRVNLPYHQPAPRSINDFLARANRKQHEYKVLKGFRDTTKANLMQDILQKARIQSKAKTQEELDKYSDSDEDWNPEEEKEKSLKNRIDNKIRNKSGGGMPLGEIKLSECESNENSNQSSVAMETVIEDSSDLPDIEDSIEQSDKDINKLVTNTDTANGESEMEVGENSLKVKESEETEGKTDGIDKVNEENIEGASANIDSEKVENVNEENTVAENNVEMSDDLLFDWEKDTAVKESSGIEDVRKTSETDVDDDKENIDPNKQQVEKSNDEQALTPSRKVNPSPKSSSKKKKKKAIAALAGIDLENVKPCLSGNADTFVSLEDSTPAPVNPGVQKLMDRLSKHSAKTEKKVKADTNISIISKDAVGIDKEELKLNTFTYHSHEEETNPLLKLETPGAKLMALKEQLKEKMKARREIARQKRQEVYDLDNEEGGYEEEAEMSDRSDTDIEDEEDEGDEVDDFEEQFGAEEEEEEEKERNPFGDDEAEEGDDEDDEVGKVDDEYEEDDDYNLRLDVTDEEQSDEEEDNSQKTDKLEESDEETEEKPSKFKEPKEPSVPEKPFSMFGKKGSVPSFSETQVPSGQSKSKLVMPIEDSHDLYNSMLPEDNDTSADKSSQQSQEFSFFIEDSQSNMLDADGYIKTKSAKKTKNIVPGLAVDEAPDTENNMDELLDLCSGRFIASQAAGKDKITRKSLFDESSVSNTQANMDDLVDMCSGVFTDKTSTQTEKKNNKRTASEIESDDDSIAAYSDDEDKHSKVVDSENEAGNNDSDGDNDDNEGDTDHLDSDEEEEQVKKFTGFTANNKHGKIRQEFVDAEAELSGSECDSDENFDIAEEDDIMEMEEGDKEAAKIDQNELRDEVGRIHLKQLIDDDKRELLRYQEMYLQDGDLYSEGGGRMRRFRWNNMEDDTQQDMFNDGSDGEEHQEEAEDFAWRKERYEREQFLKQQENEQKEDENSQFLKLGKVFLKKQVSVDASLTDKGDKSKESGSETPGFPGSFFKLSKQKRGSFLARSKEALAKIAEMTKPVVNPSAGAKSSGKFTFQVISPTKEGAEEAPNKGKQRKAHVPKQTNKTPKGKQPPAKRPKLDSQNSFTGNSIFNLI